MEITGKTALVTRANRGPGRQRAVQLRDRGARVYAAARDPQAVDLAGVTPERPQPYADLLTDFPHLGPPDP